MDAVFTSRPSLRDLLPRRCALIDPWLGACDVAFCSDGRHRAQSCRLRSPPAPHGGINRVDKSSAHVRDRRRRASLHLGGLHRCHTRQRAAFRRNRSRATIARASMAARRALFDLLQRQFRHPAPPYWAARRTPRRLRQLHPSTQPCCTRWCKGRWAAPAANPLSGPRRSVAILPFRGHPRALANAATQMASIFRFRQLNVPSIGHPRLRPRQEPRTRRMSRCWV